MKQKLLTNRQASVIARGDELAIGDSPCPAFNQSFLCWRPANAPILPDPDQSFHIDRRMPLGTQAGSIRHTVVFCAIRKRMGKWDN